MTSGPYLEYIEPDITFGPLTKILSLESTISTPPLRVTLGKMSDVKSKGGETIEKGDNVQAPVRPLE